MGRAERISDGAMRNPGHRTRGATASHWGCEHREHRTNSRWNPPEVGTGGPRPADSAEGVGGLCCGSCLGRVLTGGALLAGLTSVPAAICLSAHSDPLLEPRPNWNRKSATLSYFSVVFKHNEEKNQPAYGKNGGFEQMVPPGTEAQQ